MGLTVCSLKNPTVLLMFGLIPKVELCFKITELDETQTESLNFYN